MHFRRTRAEMLLPNQHHSWVAPAPPSQLLTLDYGRRGTARIADTLALRLRKAFTRALLWTRRVRHCFRYIYHVESGTIVCEVIEI
jgi:hypothetical protein